MEDSCPYCGEKVNWEQLPSDPFGDGEITECWDCGMKFQIIPYVQYFTEKDCSANGIACELLSPLPGNTEYKECTVCGRFFNMNRRAENLNSKEEDNGA